MFAVMLSSHIPDFSNGSVLMKFKVTHFRGTLGEGVREGGGSTVTVLCLFNFLGNKNKEKAENPCFILNA